MRILFGFCHALLLIPSLVCVADTFEGLPPRGEFHEDWHPDRNGAATNRQPRRQTPAVPAPRRQNARPSASVRNPSAGAATRRPATQRRSRILHVGPDRIFALPSMAAASARDGDIIEIDARGDYSGDEAIWRNNYLRIRGVGGRPRITAKGRLKNGKALWLIQGNHTSIENIEFAHARAQDGNGAGIRLEGRGLQVLRCYFHHNENGILSDNDPDSEIRIEYSEFAYNGRGKGRTHNIHIGRVGRLYLRFNWLHHARAGHNLKSRARENFIFYNRIMDEADGRASYQLDFPDGGAVVLLGNIVQQGPRAENRTMLSYAAEALPYGENMLLLVNNTLVNDHPGGHFLSMGRQVNMQIVNNIFTGQAGLPDIENLRRQNLLKTSPLFVARDKFDYRLQRNAAARERGHRPPVYRGRWLIPEYEYQHPARATLRPIGARLDAGALEYRASARANRRD